MRLQKHRKHETAKTNLKPERNIFLEWQEPGITLRSEEPRCSADL